LATRQTINRICARIDELAERISPPRRIFSVIVENHMNADAEIKAFAERVGTTNDDLIIAVAFVPHGRQPGDPASGVMYCGVAHFMSLKIFSPAFTRSLKMSSRRRQPTPQIAVVRHGYVRDRYHRSIGQPPSCP
jgi:hypothetical protein